MIGNHSIFFLVSLGTTVLGERSWTTLVATQQSFLLSEYHSYFSKVIPLNYGSYSEIEMG